VPVPVPVPAPVPVHCQNVQCILSEIIKLFFLVPYLVNRLDARLATCLFYIIWQLQLTAKLFLPPATRKVTGLEP
jgi:hypothetical protein